MNIVPSSAQFRCTAGLPSSAADVSVQSCIDQASNVFSFSTIYIQSVLERKLDLGCFTSAVAAVA